ncbi:MAG TPA: AMMECR1 domain-containing protein [Clostridium sp.]|nr:AMMECR1 domain-containing protein [Clostridium sp.]
MKNIIGSYLMPHPPIIIPDIGKGEEHKIDNTTTSCNTIGKEIAELKPETIIIITPHGTMFSDAVAISNEEKIHGDFRDFRAINIKMDIELDTQFNEKLIQNCHNDDIPASLIDSGTLSRYGREFTLDHGAMVPLYFINKYYTNYKLVHITYSMIGSINLYKFGIKVKKTAEELNKKCVIIASGDLSHKLKDEGPYSYSPYGEKFDNYFLNNLKNGDIYSIFTMDKNMVHEAGQCGLNSVYIMLGAHDTEKLKGDLLSYECPFGVGYGVMKFNTIGTENSLLDSLLKNKEDSYKKKLNSNNPYTKLARENLMYYYSHGSKITDLSNIPEELLNKKSGVFVSLKKFGSLRGCIGTILPVTDSIAQEIINNSISAAMNDPRFPAIEEEELYDIDISVDVLTTPVKAEKEELNPKHYGVIVSKGYKKGLLLPDLEGIDTVEKQLQIACDKGEIDYFSDNYNIEKFEVIRYSEVSD